MEQSLKHIVVIGGGFAGLNLLLKLGNRAGYLVTLVDKNNYNFFPPLLYQVATGFLDPSSICYPFRLFLRGKKNVRFRMAALLKVVPAENKVILSNGELHYDCLVLATGAKSNFFGIDSVAESAIPMKTMSDALFMRNTLLERLEEACRSHDLARMDTLATIVIAGAGPTGVELAGMFAEMRKNVVAKDYPELTGKRIGGIYLVDALQTVLAPMSEKSQHYARTTLEKMGVRLKLGVGVTSYKAEEILFSDGTSISAGTLIWAAGVKAQSFEGLSPAIYGRGGRMTVDAFNRVLDSDNIFALGDTCYQVTDPAFPNGHPQVAQVAIQQARNLGDNLLRQPDSWRPFRYRDKGSMAIIGRNKAVADIARPRMHFNGMIAWLAWAFIHVMSLLNFRNRLRTISNWGVTYFTMDQYFRMILEPDEKPIN